MRAMLTTETVEALRKERSGLITKRDGLLAQVAELERMIDAIKTTLDACGPATSGRAKPKAPEVSVAATGGFAGPRGNGVLLPGDPDRVIPPAGGAKPDVEVGPRGELKINVPFEEAVRRSVTTPRPPGGWPKAPRDPEAAPKGPAFPKRPRGRPRKVPVETAPAAPVAPPVDREARLAAINEFIEVSTDADQKPAKAAWSKLEGLFSAGELERLRAAWDSLDPMSVNSAAAKLVAL